HQVGAAAWRIGGEQPHRLGGVGLRERAACERRQRYGKHPARHLPSGLRHPFLRPYPSVMASIDSYNMRLLAHHELQGFGGLGEGMGLQLAKGGRRILWLAHESAPKNFTGVDVTDPRAPRVVVQTELPHAKMRSNSLDVVGDTL